MAPLFLSKCETPRGEEKSQVCRIRHTSGIRGVHANPSGTCSPRTQKGPHPARSTDPTQACTSCHNSSLNPQIRVKSPSPLPSSSQVRVEGVRKRPPPRMRAGEWGPQQPRWETGGTRSLSACCKTRLVPSLDTEMDLATSCWPVGHLSLQNDLHVPRSDPSASQIPSVMNMEV